MKRLALAALSLAAIGGGLATASLAGGSAPTLVASDPMRTDLLPPVPAPPVTTVAPAPAPVVASAPAPTVAASSVKVPVAVGAPIQGTAPTASTTTTAPVADCHVTATETGPQFAGGSTNIGADLPCSSVASYEASLPAGATVVSVTSSAPLVACSGETSCTPPGP